MPTTITDEVGARHRNRLDLPQPSMAKAVNKVETQWRTQVGQAVHRCFALAGVTQKEAAALLGRDTGQIARWISGEERPQLDALFGVDRFRQPIVIALAELAGEGVTIKTLVEIRRLA